MSYEAPQVGLTVVDFSAILPGPLAMQILGLLRRFATEAKRDAAIHQKDIGEKLYANKDYCNNFVFRKKR